MGLGSRAYHHLTKLSLFAWLLKLFCERRRHFMRTKHFFGRPSFCTVARLSFHSDGQPRYTDRKMPKRQPSVRRAQADRRLLTTRGRQGHMTTATSDGWTKRRKMAGKKTSRCLNEMDVGESETADVTAAAAAVSPCRRARTRLFV